MNPIIDLISPVLDKVLSFIPNPVEREKVRAEQMAQLLQILAKADESQTEINKVEAANTNLFVSGWRPFVGWVCGAGVAWTFVLQPVLDWVLAIYKPGLTTPILDSSQLLSLLLGLLGMGAMRSYDKVKGVASK